MLQKARRSRQLQDTDGWFQYQQATVYSFPGQKKS
jgi:hypothetical protein